MNYLSEKQSNAEKTVERLLTADIEKMIVRVLKKTTDQQQANIEKTVERLLKKALAKEKNVHQNIIVIKNNNY